MVNFQKNCICGRRYFFKQLEAKYEFFYLIKGKKNSNRYNSYFILILEEPFLEMLKTYFSDTKRKKKNIRFL